MTSSLKKLLLWCAVGLCWDATGPGRGWLVNFGCVQAAEPRKIDFQREIRPLLSNVCFQCHGPDEAERKGGLRLDQAEAAVQPLDSGARAIVPGKIDDSELVRRIFSTDDSERMPPPGSVKTLSEADKTLLRDWIAQGAEFQQHWSFRPVVRPEVPAVKRTEWVRNPIDRFLLARMEAEGLSPSPEADKATLIRRVTLDITGLPPTWEEVAAFLADDRPDAYEQLVDRLLKTPAAAERLTLDWLDAARFADTNGYHIDNGRDMTRWRDWVIRAFAENLPYDQFTVEQLAGDLLPEATLEQQIASGFNRNHMINFEGGAIPEEYHTAYIIDRVNTTGTVFLGLSVGCAQCHDHKFDPVSQREYYQLYAFFYNVPENGLDGRTGNSVPLLKIPTTDQQQKLDQLRDRIEVLERQFNEPNADLETAQQTWEATALQVPEAQQPPANLREILKTAADKRSPEQQQALRRYYRAQVSETGKAWQTELTEARKQQVELDKVVPTSMVMREMMQPRETRILVRGQYDQKGEPVQAAVPAALPPLPAGAPGNRLGLARWLVSREHPLTSRVTVNRYWQLVFGTGLVKTTEDFGSQGDLPSHPKLLDWLAAEFQDPELAAEHRWDLRALLRLMLTSSAYRQSSAVTPELLQRDPENRLLARGARHRLPVEFLRDQALAVSGLLDRRIGGASVNPYQPAGLWEELMSRADGKNWSAQEFVQSHGPDLYRRTMYTFWKRTCPPAALVTFDAPDRETCTVRRARTNTPLQALVLLNDPTYVEAARKLAERVLLEPGANAALEDRLDWVVKQVLSRPITAREQSILQQLYQRQRQRFAAQPEAAEKLLNVGESERNPQLNPGELATWTVISSTLLNLDEAVSQH